MKIRPRSHALYTIAAFALVFLAAGLFSCSSLRHYYRPERPDGNMREVKGSIRAASKLPKVRLDWVANLELTASPISIAAAPGVLYLSAGAFGFMTVDMSNPAAPTLVSTYQGVVAAKDPRSRFFLSVFPDLDSKRIFVMDRLHGLTEWDASNPLAPELSRKLDLGGGTNSQAITMRKIGHYYYFPAGGGGLVRISEELSEKPVVESLLASYDHTRDVSFFPPHWLLVADGHDSGMQIVDISNEKKPRLAHIFNVMTYCDQVLPIGDYALMASRGLGVVAVDMHEPARPFLSRVYFPPPFSDVKSMSLWRDRFVITSGVQEVQGKPNIGFLQIYDMEKPAEAELEINYLSEAEINTVALSGDYLIANLWGKNKLMIFRLSEV